MPDSLSLAFVSSAYNEAENLEELHQRCRLVANRLHIAVADLLTLDVHLLVADNGSTDHSLAVLVNWLKAGAEASSANLIEQAQAFDLTVLLCANLAQARSPAGASAGSDGPSPAAPPSRSYADPAG